MSYLKFADKSFVKFSHNIKDEKHTSYKTRLRMDSKLNMGQYLGVSVNIQYRKVTQQFTYLLDSISKKISSCSQCPLFQTSKLIIINSILVASLNHILAIFKIPTTITNKIDALLARFFWGTTTTKVYTGEKRKLYNFQKAWLVWVLAMWRRAINRS